MKKCVEKFKESNLDGVKTNKNVPWLKIAIKLQKEWFCVNFGVGNSSFWIKIWVSSPCLLLCAIRKLNCSEIEPWFSLRVPVCYFPKLLKPFLLTFFCSGLSCWTLVYLCSHRSNSKFYCTDNHFSATKLFLEQSKFSFIVFDMSSATGLREEITGWMSPKFVAARIFSNSVPKFFQFYLYTILMGILRGR